jgi:putative DNA primase/helicase
MIPTIEQLRSALGGEICGKQLKCPGPGHSPRDRSLSILIDPGAPDGFVLYSHAGDDWQDCRNYVRQTLGLPPWQPSDEQNRTIPKQHIDKWDLASAEAEANERPWTEDEIMRIAGARRLWDEARNPRGTLAEKYLHEVRMLNLPDKLAGSVLRFHPQCPWRNEETGKIDQVPAMIAAFRSIDDDQITAVHRIALNRDGTKLGRRMFGVVHRAAIKLDPIGPTLAIGEGIETCMAARQLGHSPAWALGSVGAISFFPIIDDVKCLQIMAETGAASERAIKLCGRRWYRARPKRRVQLLQPRQGNDLNDQLIFEATHGKRKVG